MPWRNVVAYGFAIGVFQFGLLFLGMKLGMPAGLSSIVIQMQVFFTIGLAVAFAGDRLQRHHLWGAAVAAAGVIVLAGYKLGQGLAGTFVGFLLVILAALALGRRQRHRQARRRRSRRGHVRAGRLVEPRPAAAAGRDLVRCSRAAPRRGTPSRR